jgi:hypothetical protein
LRQEIVGQLERNSLHNQMVIRADLFGNTDPATSSLPVPVTFIFPLSAD